LAFASDSIAPPRAKLFVPVLFTLTIFTSALLLFFVQPLFTRLVLPQIGGAPAVWTTAMLFFQTVLIGGYVYAHLVTRYLPPTMQLATHLALCCLAMLFLPLAVPTGTELGAGTAIVTQTLWIYALGVGLPFGALSATAPLLQTWYARTGGPSADDPYFLYSASNLGSLIALLAFPLVAEPWFGLSAISFGWSVGFVMLAALLLMSGLVARKPQAVVTKVSELPSDAPAPRLTTMIYWAFLAFIPSSLMLGVTSKISVDLGAIPLVWVVPLSLYLLTFVVTFSARTPLTSGVLRHGLVASCAALILCSFIPALTWPTTGLLVAAFFVLSLIAHRTLYEARPDARYLTLFYIVMSIGGALGGILNSILAPLLFDRFLELSLTVAFAALLSISSPPKNLPRDILIGVAVAVIAILPLLDVIPGLSGADMSIRIAVSGVLAIGMLWVLRKRGFAEATALFVLIGIAIFLTQRDLIVQDRSFFGAHIVRDDGPLRLYSNGSTIHGAQRIADIGKRPSPLYYYHQNGTMAQIINSERGRAAQTVGIVGLGVGSMACYAQPGQNWHFYEIDQKVVDIALDPTLFTFMSECGQDAAIHLGDARIVLQGQTDLNYDILVIDAYSSDAVPVHLATLEALNLYRDRLASGGLLVFHISNRFYDLSRPLAAVTKALGIEARIRMHSADEAARKDGDTHSVVVVIAENTAALGDIATDPTWKALTPTDLAPWTDDHADLLSALQ
jgi:hypothetical protein